MPKHSDLAFMYGDPENYEPSWTIRYARLSGYRDFTFYPTARDAAAVAEQSERPAISFDEVVKIDQQTFVLHVMGQLPRPKPVVQNLTKRVKFNPVTILECLADAYVSLEGIRLLRHAAWHLENPQESLWTKAESMQAHNSRLDAFAVFMGEWAAKLRKVVK